VKVSFDSGLLEVVDAAKNDAEGDPANTWRMTVVEEDGASSSFNTPPVEWDNTEGTVTMVGGHVYQNRQTAHATQGLSGKVLLGWIDFRGKAVGISHLHVDLAKYHPRHPEERFDNFVDLSGNVDEPTTLGDLGQISVVSDTEYDGDSDGMPDAWEQQIVDADLSDNIETIEDVFPDDDFDHDGWSNIQEYLRGTDPTASDNDPPQADAGEEQTVTEGAIVVLDGSGSFDPDGDILVYQWTQLSGTPVTLIDPQSAQASFTAPDVGPDGVILSFELTVTDPIGLTDEDTCNLAIRNNAFMPWLLLLLED